MRSIGFKKIIIAVLSVGIVGGGAFFVFSNNSNDNNSNEQTTQKTNTEQSVANTDAQSTEDTKQLVPEPKTETPSTPTQKPTPKPAGPTVTIEYVQQNTTAINVSAYSDHTEAGTCKAVFTKGTSTVTSNQVSSYVNAAGKNICDFPVAVKCVDAGGGNTVCTDPFIKRSEFSAAGDWQAVVVFTSGTVTASSAPKTVAIN